MAEALAAQGVPAEVVGLTGLLGLPEVADTVAMLRLVADPTAGPAALRVLTGPRWRLGAHDLVVLWRRATGFGRGGAPAVGPDVERKPIFRVWPMPSAIPVRPMNTRRRAGSA